MLEWLKKVYYSFIDSFKYNPSKLAMIVLLIPSILLGFCLTFHFSAAAKFVTYDSGIILKQIELGEVIVPAGMSAQDYAVQNAQGLFSGFQLFALMVLGTCMLFVSVNVSGKRSLSACIQSVLVSAGIIVFGIFWILNFVRTNYIYNVANNGEGYTKLTEGAYSIFSSDNLTSIICVIVSILACLVGTALAFIFRDKNYKKEVF